MKPLALIKQSLKSIWGNKVRSSLTILGIVIGIAAVISLVGLGKGLESNVTSRISNLGTTDITIQSQDPERQTSERGPGGGAGGPGGQRGGFAFGGESSASITVDEYEYIKNMDGITVASPAENTQAAVTLSEDSDVASQYNLYGVDEGYLELEDLEITSGVGISLTQIEDDVKVVLIGAVAAEELFETADPIGDTLLLDDVKFEIIGIFAEVDNEANDDAEAGPGFGRGGPNRATSSLITGYTTWLLHTESEALSSISALASSEGVVEEVALEIESTLLANHEVEEDSADFSVTTSQDLLDTVTSVATSFTTTLTGIAAISLVVGGIGIMNIMLVTVTERTREIGLRRAIGAKSRHIVIQFLLESLMLTLIGGLIGVVVGVLFGSNATELISTGFGRGPGGGSSAETQVVIDAGTILLAVGISSAIGIVFGLFPAIKAARLEPVEALRYE